MDESFGKAYEEELSKLVESIRICGQALINNASIIAGGYILQNDEIEIKISISTYNSHPPNIMINQSFMPEGILKK